jgi:hypothetical protein
LLEGEGICAARRVRAHERANVQNLCFAAQQCGIAKCAGTIVNMRKPLCNLGQVITNEMQSTRIIMMSMWTIIADTISGAIELTTSGTEQGQKGAERGRYEPPD